MIVINKNGVLASKVIENTAQIINMYHYFILADFEEMLWQIGLDEVMVESLCNDVEQIVKLNSSIIHSIFALNIKKRLLDTSALKLPP